MKNENITTENLIKETIKSKGEKMPSKKYTINYGPQQEYPDEPKIKYLTTKDLIEMNMYSEYPMSFNHNTQKMCYDYVPKNNRNVLDNLSKTYVGSVALKTMEETSPYLFNTCMLSQKAKTLHNKQDSIILSLLTQKQILKLQKLAWRHKEYETFVWLDPENRAKSLEKVIQEANKPSHKIEALICNSWCRSEHDLKSMNKYKKLFKEFSGCDYFEKTKKDLPSTITVYGPCTENGMSWSRNIETASFLRERRINLRNTEIQTKTVNKEDVVCFINNIGEQEVIILPKRGRPCQIVK